MFAKTCWLVVGVLGAIGAMAFPCEAAEGSGFDRHTWDLAMRYINFGIFAFLIYKYGKGPLVGFLREKRESIALPLAQIKEEEEALLMKQKEQADLLTQIDERIEKIKEFYRQIGQEEKVKILAEAEASSRRILQDAEDVASREFEEAKKKFRGEVVELAVRLAEERIRRNITTEDQDQLVQGWIRQLGTMEVSAE